MPHLAIALGFALCVTGCGVSEGNVYTLYRHGVGMPSMRIHLATFDADEKEDYNRENCEIAAELFAAQPGVTVRYWCEKGRFKK